MKKLERLFDQKEIIDSPKDIKKYLGNETNKRSKEENKYEDIADKPVYPFIAISVLNEMHGDLVKKISEHAKGKDNYSLMIIGPGPEAMPFTEHVQTVADWIGNGNLSLIDYNESILNKVKEYLKEKGFEKAGLNIVDIPHSANLGLKNAGEKNIFVRHGDVRKKLNFLDSSVSCIEQTVAVHHATPYLQDLKGILKEFYRVLEDDGMVHFGTGNVDMKHTETKIIQLAKEAGEKYGKDILVVDKREERNGYAVESLVERGKDYIKLPVVKKRPKGNYLEAEVDFEGFFSVKGEKFPLIDPANPVDQNQHIEKVERYYNNIAAKAIKNISQEMVDSYYKSQGVEDHKIPFVWEVKHDLLGALVKEVNDAKKGVVEYYTDPKKIASLMEEVGFKDVKVDYNTNNTFCNIVGFKR